LHLAVPGGPRSGPRPPAGGRLRRGIRRLPSRGVRAARREGALQEGPCRRDQGVHRHLGAVRAAARGRAHDRHERAKRRGERAAHPGIPGATGDRPAGLTVGLPHLRGAAIPPDTRRSHMSLAMSRSEREAFLAETRVAIVSIAEAGHGPLTVPVWYRYEPGGDVWFATGATSRKARLLRLAARASLCVQTETPPYL